MRRARNPLRITRSYAVFVQEEWDHEGESTGWYASIVGHDIDQMTFADSPEKALFMAWDVVRMLTHTCTPDIAEHDYSIDTVMSTIGYDGEPPAAPAWQCSRCGDLTVKTEIVSDVDTLAESP